MGIVSDIRERENRMRASVANLASSAKETITINFDPIYYSATPGSSAWSMVASNLTISAVVPLDQAQPMLIMTRLRGRIATPNLFIQQTIWLAPVADGNVFVATLPMPLYIRGGDSGQIQSYRQYFLFDLMYHDFGETDPNPVANAALIDPISQSARFQVDLFAATPYASVDMGVWGSLS
jgi:hypothetical protein